MEDRDGFGMVIQIILTPRDKNVMGIVCNVMHVREQGQKEVIEMELNQEQKQDNQFDIQSALIDRFGAQNVDIAEAESRRRGLLI